MTLLPSIPSGLRVALARALSPGGAADGPDHGGPLRVALRYSAGVRHSPTATLCCLALLALGACGGLVKPSAVVPSGVSCDKVFIVSTDLTAALDGRAPGDCVLLPKGTYVGNFTLPVDVSLMAGDGDVVVLRGAAQGQSVLNILGGKRTSVRGIHIDTSAGGGIAINPGPVNMTGVTITGSAQAALTVSCGEPDCDQRQVDLTDCDLTNSRFGLLVNGAFVHMVRGSISGHHGNGLTDGSGVVAAGGARVAFENVVVENNSNVGILLDGATTRASLDTISVRSNSWAGLWAQGLRGSDTLHLTGGEFTQNTLVGLGAVDSEGLTVTGTTVKQTRLLKVPQGLDRTEEVGDGIGLFQHTSGASLVDVTLIDNLRAQLLVDSAGEGIHAAGTASGGLYRAVVQHTVAAVDLPAQLLDKPAPLFLVDAKIAVTK